MRSRFKRRPADRVTREESTQSRLGGHGGRGVTGLEALWRPWSDPNQGRRRRRPFLLAFHDFPPLPSVQDRALLPVDAPSALRARRFPRSLGVSLALPYRPLHSPPTTLGSVRLFLCAFLSVRNVTRLRMARTGWQMP